MFSQKEYMKAYRKRNRNKLSSQTREWRKRNQEKAIAHSKTYREKNPDSNKEFYSKYKQDPLWVEEQRANGRVRGKVYYQKNKDKICIKNKERSKLPIVKMQKQASSHRRRIGTLTLNKNVVQQVYEENIKKYSTLTCELCLKPVAFGDDHLEHFHPVS